MASRTFRHRAKSALLSATLATSVLVPLTATPAAAATTDNGRIAGKVLAEGFLNTNEPGYARVCVSVFGINGNHFADTVTADDAINDPIFLGDSRGRNAGTYQIDGLVAGSYKVRFADCGNNNLDEGSDPGLATIWSGGAKSFDAAQAVTITPEDAEDTNGDITINIAMGLDATIQGRLQEDNTGVELGDVCVTAYDGVSGAIVAETVSKSGATGVGDYNITGLPAGTYKVGYSDNRPECGAITTIGGSTRLSGLGAVGSTPIDDGREESISDVRAGTEANQSHAPEFFQNQSTLSTAGAIVLETNVNATNIDGFLAKLVTTAGISGAITSTAGGAASPVCVSAYRSDGSFVKTRSTNPSGGYSMGLDPAQYALEVHERCVNDVGIDDDQYVATFTGGIAPSDETAPAGITRVGALPTGVTLLTVNAGQFTTGNLAVARRGVITGVVTDEASPAVPLSDVCVVAMDGSGATTSPLPSAVTGDDGVYTITSVRPAEYVIRFRATDVENGECGPPAHAANDRNGDTTNGYLSEYYNGVAAKASATKVTVSTGQTRNLINASLRSDANRQTVSGQVTREGSNAAIANVCVKALDLDQNFIDAALTASDGTYTIDAVPSGSYRIKFTTTESCDTNGDGTAERTAETEPRVNNSPNLQYLGTEFHGNATHFEAASTVTVNTSPVAGINGVLAVGGRIDGLVTTAANTSDVCVQVFDNAKNVIQAKPVTPSVEKTTAPANPGTAFTFHGVVPGRHFVGADDHADTDKCSAPAGSNTFQAEFHQEKRTLTDATPIDLAANTTQSNIKLTMDAVGAGAGNFQRVHGQVFDPDSDGDCSSCDDQSDDDEQPLRNVRVDLFRLDQDPAKDAPALTTVTCPCTDKPGLVDGEWEIRGGPAGTYKIRFTDLTGIHAVEWHRSRNNFEDANGVPLGSAEVEVAERAVSSKVAGARKQGTVLAQAGNIEGRVSIEADGAPVVGATVEALNEESGAFVASAKTAADGRYRLSGLLPGGYKIHFVPSQSVLTAEYYDNQFTLSAANVVTVATTQTRSAINAQLKKNNPPQAGDDNVQAEVNKTTTYRDLTSNDLDPDGDQVAITSVGSATHGSVVLNSDGSVSYTPQENNKETATFSYTVADPRGLSDTATVTVEIVGQIIGVPPRANDDEVTTAANTAVSIDVLANDTDPDGSTKPTIVSTTVPFHGDAVIDNGRVVYTPDAGFSGLDQFAYQIRDEQGFTANGKVTVTVRANGVNEKTGSVGANGSLATDGSEATADNPIITTVTTPNAGTVTIKEEKVPAGKVSDISTLTWRSVITAPAATAARPLTITFRLDGSLMQGVDQPARAIRVLRNNALVGDCLGSATANPDPCISGHRMVGDDVLVTIKTSAASTWTFGFDNDAVVDRASGASGTGRVGTAVAVSRNAFSPAEVDTVVIARKDAYPDALAGAPLAHKLGAPLLLTTTDKLDTITRDEIVRLGASRVVILGGTAAVSSGVESALRAINGVNQVDRIRGADRFATAAAVAQQLGNYDLAYVVEGADANPSRGWPDAVAVASLAAFEGRPILLVTTAELPSATRTALQGLREAVIIGGTASVSSNVANAIDQVVGSVGRVRGTDRYETSFAVAQRAVAAGMSASSVWIATGQNFPDALAAGPAAAKEGGILLLVNGNNYDASPSVERFLTANRTKVETLTIVGGTAVVSVGSQVRMAQATTN